MERTASTALAIRLDGLTKKFGSGTAALAMQRYNFFGKNAISFLFVLPIALPGVVTGISLQSSFKLFGIDLGLHTIVIAHTTFCVVVAYNNVVARLRRHPRSPEEAELDLRGLTLSEADLSELLSVDPKRWEREMHERTGHLTQFAGLPTEISAAHERAVHRFGALP